MHVTISSLSRLVAMLLLPAASLVVAKPAPEAAPEPAPEPDPLPGLKIPVVDTLLNLLNNPPPKILRTTNPSPQCAAINGGEYQCCRAMVAGDIQLVVWLSSLYGYQLNPNDINGLNCKHILVRARVEAGFASADEISER